MDDVRNLLAAGEFTYADLLWHEGLTEWVPIEQVVPRSESAPSVPLPFPADNSPPPPPSYVPPPASSYGYQGTGAPNHSVPLTPAITYAGFWKRLAAYFIDSILLSIAFTIVATIVMVMAIAAGEFVELMAALLLFLINLAGYWLYFALMESSVKQATLGKMALGIIVTDADGNRVGFGRATGRHFGKILSGLILSIGFIMAAFTERKQGLHDLLASTLVINKIR